MLKKFDNELGSLKFSLGDYIRLVQLHKEMEEDKVREIKVTWVEPEKSTEETPGIEPRESKN